MYILMQILLNSIIQLHVSYKTRQFTYLRTYLLTLMMFEEFNISLFSACCARVCRDADVVKNIGLSAP